MTSYTAFCLYLMNKIRGNLIKIRSCTTFKWFNWRRVESGEGRGMGGFLLYIYFFLFARHFVFHVKFS